MSLARRLELEGVLACLGWKQVRLLLGPPPAVAPPSFPLSPPPSTTSLTSTGHWSPHASTLASSPSYDPSPPPSLVLTELSMASVVSSKAWKVRPSDTLTITETEGLPTKVVVLGHEDTPMDQSDAEELDGDLQLEEVVDTMIDVVDTPHQADHGTQVLKHKTLKIEARP